MVFNLVIQIRDHEVPQVGTTGVIDRPGNLLNIKLCLVFKALVETIDIVTGMVRCNDHERNYVRDNLGEYRIDQDGTQAQIPSGRNSAGISANRTREHGSTQRK